MSNAMYEYFLPGDMVCFQTDRGGIIIGVPVRLNKKSVTFVRNQRSLSPEYATGLAPLA